MATAMMPNGTCLRCRAHSSFRDGRCSECGVKANRVVRRVRRRKIGGKRGRNSGRVRTNK